MAPKISVLILVHGMGEQRQHETLTGVMVPLIQAMKDRGESPWEPEVSANLAFANQSDAEVTYGDRVWRFAEYWWARGFNAAPSGKVALWIARRLLWHLNSMRKSMGHAGSDLKETVTKPNEPKDPVSARLYNAVALPLYSSLVLLLLVLTPFLVLALVVLGYMKLLPGVPSFINYVQQLLNRIGVDFLGDIYICLNDSVQAALIRGGLERMVEEAVSDADVDRIVLFAHSTGNLVVYDALAHLRSSGVDLSNVKAFISIGSILPMAWNNKIIRQGDTRFLKPMPDHIHWYHLWTRFDIGPAGPLEVPNELRGQGPEVCNMRVSNADDLLLDHTGYWTNPEQVHMLLLEEMGGLDPANHFWRGPGLTESNPDRNWRSRSAQTWEDFNMRRRAVAQLAWVRLATLAVLPLAFSLMLWFNGWAKGIADFLQIDWIARSVRFAWLSDAISSPDLSVAATVGVGALVSVLLFAGVFILVYVGFKFAWWNRSFESRRRLRDQAFRDWRFANHRGNGVV